MDLYKHKTEVKKRNVHKRGGFSVVIVPHYQGKTKRIEVTPTKIYLSVVSLVVAGALLGGFIFSYTGLKSQVAQFKGAKFDSIVAAQSKELQITQNELAKTQSQLDALKEYVVSLSSLEKEVRNSLKLGESKVSLEYVLERTPKAKLQSTTKLPENVAKLLSEENNVTQIAEDRAKMLNMLKGASDEYHVLLAETPNIWPLHGYVSSPFGWRPSPFGSGWEFHKGIDICAYYGAPIRATADGTVEYAGWFEGYGRFIKIYHRDGIETCYGHLSKIIVKAGEHVKKGQVIGYEGDSGLSTGPHLHYEVRINGVAVNPAKFLP